ncbi:MAG: PaaI family thioesterase [Acidimicrobiales bacterium]
MERNTPRVDVESTRRALANQVRALAGAVLLTTEGDDAMVQALQLLSDATALLDRSVRASRYEGVPGLVPGRSDTNDAVWETHAMFGASNPIAPPLLPHDRTGRVEATVTFGPAYEGGPGSVYGGFIAAAFDAILGRAVISSGRLGVTRSLTVRYIRPTPLGAPLRIEAEVGAVIDRNVEVSGLMRSGDDVTCEADAVFVCVEPDRYRL